MYKHPCIQQLFFASTGNMMSQHEANSTFMYMQMVHSRNKALLEIWQRPQNYGTKCEISCMSQIQDTHNISCNKNVSYLFVCLKLEQNLNTSSRLQKRVFMYVFCSSTCSESEKKMQNILQQDQELSQVFSLIFFFLEVELRCLGISWIICHHCSPVCTSWYSMPHLGAELTCRSRCRCLCRSFQGSTRLHVVTFFFAELAANTSFFRFWLHCSHWLLLFLF